MLARHQRDLAQVRGRERIDETIVSEGFTMMGIDEAGLVSTDRRILQAVGKGEGEPVGLKTIDVSVGEDESTIEEVYEPFLIQRGFLVKTSRGRKVTTAGLKHLGEHGFDLGLDGNSQNGLFS